MVERDRETVVVTDTGERSGASGAIIAIVLLLALLIGGYLLYRSGMFGGGGSDTKVDIKIENPLKEGGK